MSDILKSLTVLFVEDEDKIRTSMGSAMEGIFAKVILAGNGDEGLKKFKKFNPDVIVTDISMPIMDGLDMSKEIRDISKDTPIVILSAFSEKEKLLKAIEIGIDKYIIKPIDMEELFEAISVLAQDKISTTNIVEIGGGYSFNKTKKSFSKKSRRDSSYKKRVGIYLYFSKKIGYISAS